MFTIEDNIPIPEDGRRGSGIKNEARKVLESLEPGQSVVLPASTAAVASRIRTTSWNIQKNMPGRVYSCRRTGKILRIWRIS